MKKPIFTIPLFVLIMILVVFAFALVANNVLAYINSTIKNSTMIPSNVSSFSLDNIQTKKVRVGDIDVAYKVFGKGKPLLLIPGFSATMYVWDTVMLDKLSSNHTIIVFDNRGIGKTTVGTKTWTIEQFANDTAGLIDALGIRKPIDVLGLSWGGYVAQELTLMHPQKVSKLILYGTDCGGKATILYFPPNKS
jgi:alpha-beta hydrolase superfamily lysophospholipase